MSKHNLAFLISAYVLLVLIVLTSAKAAAHRHSVNISGGHKHPITDCSDLRIQFDERDAVMRSEERTLTKSEAPVLQIHPHENGGVQIVGWDKDIYSVTACKAAAGSGDAAERILSQITLSIEKGRISTKGPADDGDWTVYLLIRAPKSASLDLDTMNGPISLYDVNGKLTARAHHGPLTLKVPNGYQSSFVVESRNYAPVSCEAIICDNARKTWDDNNRRIEYGAAPAMIRLSTVNGPVSVRDSREKL